MAIHEYLHIGRNLNLPQYFGEGTMVTGKVFGDMVKKEFHNNIRLILLFQKKSKKNFKYMFLMILESKPHNLIVGKAGKSLKGLTK